MQPKHINLDKIHQSTCKQTPQFLTKHSNEGKRETKDIGIEVLPFL
jgi:hypothetical protein